MQDSHPTLKTWYHLYISDPFWWSTALYNLVWNTQKNGQFFLSAKARCLLVLKKF